MITTDLITARHLELYIVEIKMYEQEFFPLTIETRVRMTFSCLPYCKLSNH